MHNGALVSIEPLYTPCLFFFFHGGCAPMGALALKRALVGPTVIVYRRVRARQMCEWKWTDSSLILLQQHPGVVVGCRSRVVLVELEPMVAALVEQHDATVVPGEKRRGVASVISSVILPMRQPWGGRQRMWIVFPTREASSSRGFSATLRSAPRDHGISPCMQNMTRGPPYNRYYTNRHPRFYNTCHR